MKAKKTPIPTKWTVEAYDAAWTRMHVTARAVNDIRGVRDELRKVGAHHVATKLHGVIKSAEGANNHAVGRFLRLRALATPEQLLMLAQRT